MPQRRAGGPLQRLKLEGAVPFPWEPQAREAAGSLKTLSHRECPPQPGQFRAVGVGGRDSSKQQLLGVLL